MRITPIYIYSNYNPSSFGMSLKSAPKRKNTAGNPSQAVNDSADIHNVSVTGKTNNNDKKIYSTKEGYNKIAKYYDTWNWQKFWAENEMPLIIKWSGNKKNHTVLILAQEQAGI